MIELTGWEPLGISVDWAAIEGELGVPLPADYKELYEAFGGGVFSDSVYFLGRDEGVSFDFLTQWRVALSVDQDSTLGDVSAVDPYAIYAPGGKGVVAWGSTEWADEYCWLIDAERPGDYPVLARSHDGGPWHWYDMSTSEFLYRARRDSSGALVCPWPAVVWRKPRQLFTDGPTASLPMPISSRSASRSTTSAQRSSPAPATPPTASRSAERLAVPRSWTRQCRRFSSRSGSQVITNCLRNRSPNAVPRDQRSQGPITTRPLGSARESRRQVLMGSLEIPTRCSGMGQTCSPRFPTCGCGLWQVEPGVAPVSQPNPRDGPARRTVEPDM
ncbi:SMI1/KNR4 family protein [Streptomyces incanus]